MGNYCAYTDIETLLQMSFTSPTSQPTGAKVTELCEQITAEIDIHLALIGITTQPTNTTQLSLLKLKSSMGVAGIVGRTYIINGVEGTTAVNYYKEYTEFLSLLDKSPEIFKSLSGAGLSSFGNQVTDGIESKDSVVDKFNNIFDMEV